MTKDGSPDFVIMYVVMRRNTVNARKGSQVRSDERQRKRAAVVSLDELLMITLKLGLLKLLNCEYLSTRMILELGEVKAKLRIIFLRPISLSMRTLTIK